jgi:hypothetical protein
MEERLDHARSALAAYFAAKGEPPRATDTDFEETDASDLIADLLHFQKSLGFKDEDSTLATALMHYQGEQEEYVNAGGDSGKKQPCLAFRKHKTAPLTELVYMPEESTPTIATRGNREAVAYLELGEHTDYYGRLFAKAPQLLDKLLDIKLLAESDDDTGYEPYTLLELIAHEARTIIQAVTRESASSLLDITLVPL